MASFAHLPAELVEYIVGYFYQSDILTICRLNKNLHALASPFLYRHVDLYIPPGNNNVPRIDRFCLNIVNDSRLASRVESLRLGLRPDEGVKEGQHWLPADKHFDDGLMFSKAMDAMSNKTLVAVGDYLRDAIGMREYSAYAALILLVLPALQHLEIADLKSATLDHLHTVLRNLNAGTTWNRRHASQALLERLSSIQQLSLNTDSFSGLVYRRDPGHPTLDHLLNLTGIKKLEISIPENTNVPIGALFIPGNPNRLHGQLVSKIRPTNITTIVVKHSGPVLQLLHSLFGCTPHLVSLTYDTFVNCNERERAQPGLIDLAAWSDALEQVKDTLETLVLSVEYCDTATYPFNQPRIGDKLHGYLNLTNFSRLQVLEVPFPFLTGDVVFSITTEIYPLFPPNLRHLSLRTDLSHAQFPFLYDSAILPNGLTFHESEKEARYLMNARMDVSYMFHATLILLEHAPKLETLSVWQSADPTLGWFDGQLKDFATTCRNRSITGRVLYPMLLRWKKAQHWNLIREITVFDRLLPDQVQDDKFFRGERADVPLGLASQYHLHALRSHQVKLHR